MLATFSTTNDPIVRDIGRSTKYIPATWIFKGRQDLWNLLNHLSFTKYFLSDNTSVDFSYTWPSALNVTARIPTAPIVEFKLNIQMWPSVLTTPHMQRMVISRNRVLKIASGYLMISFALSCRYCTHLYFFANWMALTADTSALCVKANLVPDHHVQTSLQSFTVLTVGYGRLPELKICSRGARWAWRIDWTTKWTSSK